MTYKVEFTNSFKKDYLRVLKRGYNEKLIVLTIAKIANSETLSPKYKLHKLSGEFEDCWECHIKPDWLMIWIRDDIAQKIVLIRTGTHVDLF